MIAETRSTQCYRDRQVIRSPVRIKCFEFTIFPTSFSIEKQLEKLLPPYIGAKQGRGTKRYLYKVHNRGSFKKNLQRF